MTPRKTIFCFRKEECPYKKKEKVLGNVCEYKKNYLCWLEVVKKNDT